MDLNCLVFICLKNYILMKEENATKIFYVNVLNVTF